jgi:hypothetical protein
MRPQIELQVEVVAVLVVQVVEEEDQMATQPLLEVQEAQEKVLPSLEQQLPMLVVEVVAHAIVLAEAKLVEVVVLEVEETEEEQLRAMEPMA